MCLLKSKLITFEGIDGSGKTTQAILLKYWLKNKGIFAYLSREPGGSIDSEKIRTFLFEHKKICWDIISNYFFLTAARRQHLLQTIYPFLDAGKLVICDRFQDSSIVYQGFGEGISISFMQNIYKYISGKFYPNITFIMLINIDESFYRVQKRNIFKEDLYNSMKSDFYERLCKGYKKIYKNNQSKYIIVDSSHNIIKVWNIIKIILEERFNI